MGSVFVCPKQGWNKARMELMPKDLHCKKSTVCAGTGNLREAYGQGGVGDAVSHEPVSHRRGCVSWSVGLHSIKIAVYHEGYGKIPCML